MSSELFDLTGRVAMVTGASRGIGQGIALGLAGAGADIVAISRGSCEETEREVATLGRRFLHLPCDLAEASVADLQKLVDQAVELMGGLDILVNAAGTITRHSVLEYPEEEWDQVLQVNLKAVMYLSQAAARHFAEVGKGKIINIASALSVQGGILVPAYAAAKHGVVGVTRSLANELAAKGINVNAIIPGYILTDMTAPLAADPSRNEPILARIPAGRWGKPSDFAGVAVFLASRASDYCDASIIAVDGGWLSR